MLHSFNAREQDDCDAKEPSLGGHFDYEQNPFHELAELPYFAIPAWEQHLDLLQHLSRFSKVLQIVIGEPQSGKTTLLSQLQRQTRETAQVYTFNASPNCDLPRLGYHLLQGFNVAPYSEHDDLMNGLIEQVEQLKQRVNPSLLLIDNAQDLPKETLAALLTLTEHGADTVVTLHVVLFGTPRVIKQLNSLNLQLPIEELTHILEISPLSAEEAEHYLHFRLQYAGFIGNFPFSSQQVERIWQESCGLPGRVNDIAQGLLGHANFADVGMMGALGGRFRSHLPKIIGASVIAFVLLLLLVFQNQINRWFQANPQPTKRERVAEPESTLTITQESTQQPLMQDQLQPNLAPVVAGQSMLEAQQLNGNGAQLQHITPPNQGLPTDYPTLAGHPAVPMAAPSLPGTATSSITSPALASIYSKPMPQAPVLNPAKTEAMATAGVPRPDIASFGQSLQPAMVPAAAVAPSTAGSVMPQTTAPKTIVPVLAATATPAEKTLIPVVKTPSSAPVEKPVSAKQRAKVVKSGDKPVTATEAKAKPTPIAKRASSPAGSRPYSLQLISLSDEARAKAFITQHHLAPLGQTHHIKKDGKDVFVVTYGQYATLAQANQTAQALQAREGISAWVRDKKA